MAEKDLLIKEKVAHTGIFDFPAFYAFAHSWFKDEEYGVDEEKYSEKLTGNKREILIEWKATKGLSEYFKIEQKIKFDIKNLADVEVEIDGKTKKMNNGSVEVDIKAALVRDPDSKWETSPYARFMREVYNKYVIPSRVQFFKEKVIADVKAFKEELKAFLELIGKR